MNESIWVWAGFNLFIIALLLIDLGIFNRKSHEVKTKEALTWTGVWISIALLFNMGIYFWKGQEKAMEFLAGYLIEKSLSVDNLFVFLMIFSFFKVPKIHQHKVLYWGIFGALIMRAVMIGTGAALVSAFHWVLYIFGGLLVYTGLKMAFKKEDGGFKPGENPVVRAFKRFFPVTADYHEDSFFVRNKGILMATPLFITLIMIETSDLIFAIDSIPAIFGISSDPFIIYTSNVFAILGLRSLFFALASVMDKFHYLKYGLSGVLVFIGTKMLIADLYKIPIAVALGVVMAILLGSVLLSLLKPEKKEEVIEPTIEKENAGHI
jgi:tellurite resistance protein TerC